MLYLIRIFAWLRDIYEGLTWFEKAVFLLFGSGAVVIGPYEIELSLTGKIFVGLLLLILVLLIAHLFVWLKERWSRSKEKNEPPQTNELSCNQLIPVSEIPNNGAGKTEHGKLPGFSGHLIVKLEYGAERRRKYFFNMMAPEKSGIAFYLSASDHFVLEATDTRSERYPLEIPVGQSGIPLSQFVYLACEIGVSSSYTFLCVLLNGNEIARRQLSFPIDLGSKKWASGGGTIGSSKGKNSSCFSLGELVIYSMTLNTEEAENLKNYFRDKWGIMPDGETI